jgi:Synergist-CTERM protein sorting domain-containing protein
MKRMKACCLAIAAAITLCLAGFAPRAEATIWKVTRTDDNPSNPAEGSLRHAVNNAWNNDFITFESAGMTIDLSEELSISKTLTIVGSGTVSPTTIRQTAPGKRVFSIAPGVFGPRFEYLIIRGGNAAESGGAILNRGYSLTLHRCTLDGNSAANYGGGIDNHGKLTLNIVTVKNNSASSGGGIKNRTGSSCDMYMSTITGNTPDQIVGAYTTDGHCTIGDSAGTASVAFGGIPEGLSPKPRKTSGEADVTAVENDLKKPESSLFAAVKSALAADLGGLTGDVSAGLSGMNATLYDAFAYEDIPLSDTSGEGKLEVEFTASWPKNVRYYAALAEYADAAAGARAVKGYVIPERGVQFEIKPGQALPGGMEPPDFYEEGEGLMTWRNVVEDNGPYDHNPQDGVVTFRVTSIRAEAQTAPTGGSGCSSATASPFALLLGVPLLLLRKTRRI